MGPSSFNLKEFLNTKSYSSIRYHLSILYGGVHVSIDALGYHVTCVNSIENLRKRGKHIQLGWMVGKHANPKIPMEKILGYELEILGVHGMQAHRFDDMLAMIQSGKIAPQKMIAQTVNLDQSIEALMAMENSQIAGVTVITEF